MKELELTNEEINYIKELVDDGLFFPKAEHKQYFLYKIADFLDMDVTEYKEGESPV